MGRVNKHPFVVSKVKRSGKGTFILAGNSISAEVLSVELLEPVFFQFSPEIRKQTQSTFCVISDEQMLVKLNLN